MIILSPEPKTVRSVSALIFTSARLVAPAELFSMSVQAAMFSSFVSTMAAAAAMSVLSIDVGL